MSNTISWTETERVAHVHRAYKNPPKQNAASSVSTTNCAIIALSAKTIRLFFNVTKASLSLMLSVCQVAAKNEDVPWKHQDGNESKTVYSSVTSPWSWRLRCKQQSRQEKYGRTNDHDTLRTAGVWSRYSTKLLSSMVRIRHGMSVAYAPNAKSKPFCNMVHGEILRLK